LETKDKGGKEENAEFQAQREAAIAQIQKSHAAAPARIKSLVGSKQVRLRGRLCVVVDCLIRASNY
jgi:hypothetical protein